MPVSPPTRTVAGHFHPLFFDLHDRRVLIVGGGALATRKGIALAAAGARITVIAPRIAGPLARCADTAIRRIATTADLDTAPPPELVVLATDDAATQRRLRAACRRRRLWCNQGDDPDASDFVTPVRIDRPPFTIGLVSQGASPALSALVRRTLEASLSPALSELARVFAELRPRVKACWPDQAKRAAFFRRWASAATLARLEREGRAAIERAMAAELGEADDKPCPRRRAAKRRPS